MSGAESEPTTTSRSERRLERKRARLERRLQKVEEAAAQAAAEPSEVDPTTTEEPQAAGEASAEEARDEAAPPSPAKALSPQQRDRRYIIGQAAIVIAILIFPWTPFATFSIIGRANLASQYALVAISLVVLTGWVGQVSLGQAAFVGVGAFVTGIANEAWNVAFPANLVVGLLAGAATAMLLGIVALRVRGLYLAVATLIFSWTADSFLFQQDWLTRHSSITVDPIGQPGSYPFLDFTSRRTFYYAAWATVALVIFLVANLRDRKFGRAFFAIRGSEMAAASLGIDVVRTKLLAFAISGAIAGLAGSLTLVGAQVVVGDQFSLSQSLFFLAIAVVGGLTSLPGAVASGMVFAAMEEVFFRFPAIGDYLQLFSAGLLAAVLLLYPGGLAAMGRALWTRLDPYLGRATDAVLARLEPVLERRRTRAAAAVTKVDDEADDDGYVAEGEVAAPAHPSWLPQRLVPLFNRLRGPFDKLKAGRDARRQVRQVTSVVDFGASLRVASPEDDEIVAEAESPNGHAELDPDEPADYLSWETLEIEDPNLTVADRHLRRPLIEADKVTVRFGGLTAVNGFSLQVREGEIVGLIGPNGAGKTTSFNSIAGFNTPAEGRVRIHGLDVTGFPVYLRSRLGVARTFQAIQLFPQLDVFDNLMVATYTTDTSGLFGNLFASDRSLMEEYRARERVSEVIRLLDLEDVAHRTVADLPFGVLRMVEIARALVTGAPVIMLDEPASGLDDLETERLTKLVRFIRSLGVTILLIEHDVQMVTSVSDYLYVIDQGTPIAEGSASDIKSNPVVIAAYLGEETHEGDEAVEPEAVEAGT